MHHHVIRVGALSAAAAIALIASGCGDDSSGGWEAGAAVADLVLDDGTSATFTGGTCERGKTSSGNDSFRLNVGEPGADGEGAADRRPAAPCRLPIPNQRDFPALRRSSSRTNRLPIP